MTTFKKSAVLAAAFVGLFAGSARAQETVVVNVPFSFAVRGEEFPAGRYDVTTEEGMVTIRGINNRAEIVTMTLPASGRDPAGQLPALVFVRHADEYQLSQVWETSDDGFAIPEPSPSHRTKGKPIAAATPAVVIVPTGM